MSEPAHASADAAALTFTDVAFTPLTDPMPDGPLPAPFDGPEDADMLYAVIDAHLLPALEDDIARDDLQAACLFTGEAGKALGEVAPWLVALPGRSRLLNRLLSHVDGAPAHWTYLSRGAGIFLRSPDSFADVFAHLRRFTKPRREDGSDVYFRFWQPDGFAAYLAHVVAHPQSGAGRAWCHGQRAQISAIIALHETVDGWRCAGVNAPVRQPPVTAGPFTLATGQIAAIAVALRARDILAMVKRLEAAFPDTILPDARPDTAALIKTMIDRMKPYQLRQMDHLIILSAWEHHFGPFFHTADAVLEQVIAGRDPASVKMQRLQARMVDLTPEDFDRAAPSPA